MGLLDHQRTWVFTVSCDPDECVSAFARALAGKGILSMRKVKWEVRREVGQAGLPAAVGTYGGRGGLAAAMTGGPGSRTGEIESIALGSQLRFDVAGYDPRQKVSTCEMYLATRGTKFGLTADAGQFRSYMNDVSKQLQAIDPSVRLEKTG